MTRSPYSNKNNTTEKMDAASGLIIMAVLAGLLCLRRLRCPESAEMRQEKMAVLMHCEVERKPEA